MTSEGGAYYLFTIIDDFFFRKIWTFFLKKKNDVFVTFKKWKTIIEKQTKRYVILLYTYNGLEFRLNEFNSFHKSEGILRYLIVHSTSQQNVVAEQIDRTLMENV